MTLARHGFMMLTVAAMQPLFAQQFPVSSGAVVNAKAVFAGKCSWCHAAYGAEADKGPRLAGSALTDAQLEARIRLGVAGSMPGFGDSLTEAEITALVKHIRSLPVEKQ